MPRKPRIFTSKELDQVEALGAVLSIEQTADYFGISKVTFYKMMERQPDISLRYKLGKSKAIGSIANSLLSKARAGDNQAMIFYLKCQGRWKQSQTVDVTSSDGSMKPTVINLVAPDDDD